MSSVLSDKHFHDERAAYAYVEARIWPNGPICPHCGNTDKARITKLAGESTRIGVHKCKECRKPFTVKVGTVFESSHVALRLWLQAIHLLCSSKKGISSNQLHRTLGVTLKTAWFMSHRIREAMRAGSLAPMGGAGSIVEIDETLSGKIAGAPKRLGPGWHFAWKNTVLALVERGGAVRTFHVEGVTMGQLLPIIRANVARETVVMTDEHAVYKNLGSEFAEHHSVNHSAKEYARGPVTTNTVEGVFSIFKRGMKGVYQHCDERHLHRYLAEFDFRYSNRVALGINDIARADLALKGAIGKRLTYQTTAH